jgi:nitrate/nitrite transporter NarK
LALIVAGEMVFSLPFHTTRFFRPTMLEAFGLSNTQLGDIFAVYGITAMLAYFPGGMIADRFSARLLITVSLLATAAGGLYMATYPGAFQMGLLYGFWGITSVLLLWAALISATRDWGGKRSQGMAFGILDGGRGLFAAAFAVLAVAVLASYMPDDMALVSNIERKEGFRTVILLYSAATALAAGLTWLVLPKSKATTETKHHNPMTGIAQVVSRPLVWAKAGIIVCAYCCFKGLDNYSLYAVQVLGMDEVEAASFTANASFLRLFGAVAAGFVADRFSASKAIFVTFLVLCIAYAGVAITTLQFESTVFIIANLLVSFFAAFALRGIYFALLEETRTPKYLTGTTIGLISAIGYTPDVFFAPVAGRILDASPGAVGHQHYFIFLGGIALTGMLVAGGLILLNRNNEKRQSAWLE